MNTRYFWAWMAIVPVMLALDALWLGVIAKEMYQQCLGHLMADEPRLGAGTAFYPLYTGGLMLFAVVPGALARKLGRTALLGAMCGLFAYGTYDLTNLAVMRDWPLGLSLIDMAWGTFASAVAATAGGVVERWLATR